MKHIGIWMDLRKAFILTIEDQDKKLKKIVSNIETYHVHGGSGSRFKGGPQDVVQDSKYLEREKHQFKEYSKEIMVHLKRADEVIIFGPAEAGIRLNKELQKNHGAIGKKVIEVLKADSMTENQIKALIRDYFRNKLN